MQTAVEDFIPAFGDTGPGTSGRVLHIQDKTNK